MGQFCAWGNARLWSQNNILHGGQGKLRTSGASPIFGGHRMALGHSGLHTNNFFANPK